MSSQSNLNLKEDIRMNKRKEQETKEDLQEVVNNAPKARYQNTQQIQDTMDAEANTENGGFQLKKQSSKGSQLKQEAVAKVINDAVSGSANSGMGISAAGTRGVSGTAGGVLGAANGTPIADKARKDSRYGKKLDRIGTKLNFTPSEQVVQEYDESKPLADAADMDQGYNGTYRNEYARSQKKVGNAPSELLFDRSVDYIYKDQLYYGQGQYVKQTGISDYQDSPTQKMESGTFGILDYPTDVDGSELNNYSVAPGNYLMRNLNMTLDANGKVQELYFDTEDLTPTVSAERCNRSSVAGAIDRNAAEIDRQSMDAKAGDEKADIWTPLARAVKQPTQVVGFLRDLEQITGNEVLLAYKKASTSLSHQLNRAPKDGQTIVDPAVEALLGCIVDANTPEVLNSVFKSLPKVLDKDYDLDPTGDHYYVTKQLNSKGQAGVMLQVYDSVTKYTSKQDLLLQPRSFRMHLQTADNNMNPLHANKRFAQVIAGQEVYSTIDREYDPLLPICVSDKAAIIHRYNFNRFFAKVKTLDSAVMPNITTAPTTFTHKIVDGHLTEGAKQLTTKRYLHALISDKTLGHGTLVWDSSNNGYIPQDTFGSTAANNKVLFVVNDRSESYGSDAGVTIDGVTYYEFNTVIDLNSYLGVDILFAMPDGASSIVATTKTAFNGGEYVYGYSDLRNNYVVHANLPLIEGFISYIEDSIGGKLYSLLDGGKISIPMIHSTQYFSLWSFMVCAATPFIVNARINALRDVLYYEKNVEYPFSQLESLGSIGVKSYANFNFVDYDNPIEVKTMNPVATLRWVMPEIFWKPTCTVSESKPTAELVVMPFYMNQENYSLNAADSSATINEDAAAMSMPSIRSGSRLAELDQLYGMTEKDIRLSYDCAIPMIPSATVTAAYAYKYGKTTDGIISFALSDNAFADITIKEWLTNPRELGYIIDAPYGVLTPKVTGASGSSLKEKGQNILSSVRADFLESATRGNSFRIKCWAGEGYATHTLGSGTQNILASTDVNVNRAANFKQTWYEVVANGKRPTFDAGMLFSLNHTQVNGTLGTGEAVFTPFINDASGASPASTNVISLQKAIWTRIQKLPFVISPFEGCDYDSSATTSVDPFDLAICFGLCGFRASDYRESVYNREKEFVNQGYLFVNDPWVEASPIFREGASASGVSVTRGYEV